MKKKSLLIVMVLAALTIICGCDNVGNENPITPEQMDKERAKQMDERANFQPPTDTKSPGG